MNRQAEQHLSRAEDYVTRGEEFYRKAAEEIVAAREADFTLTWEQVAKRMGKSDAWCREIVQWHTNPQSTARGNDVSPFAEEKGAVAKRHAKSVAKNEPRALIDDAEARVSLTKALDEHYTQKAKESAERKREKEVDRVGGESEYAEHQQRQHIAETVNVARGATSGWRFVAGQVRSLSLDDGAREELAALADETEGFVSMLRSILRGEEITDAALAALIGDEA